MSLINDALKRAREAQDQAAPPPPAPALRPVEPSQTARHGLGVMLPAALAVVALLVLLFVWQYSQRDTVRKAGGPTPENTAPVTSPAQQHAVQPPVTAPAATSVAAVPPAAAPQIATNPASVAAVAQPAPAPTANTESNALVVAVQAPPKPAPLRLQGIVFNPTSPSAMISGKTVYVGDKLGQMRVVAINQQSATLVGNGETNVLTFAQ
jgi:hypothetical protein